MAPLAARRDGWGPRAAISGIGLGGGDEVLLELEIWLFRKAWVAAELPHVEVSTGALVDMLETLGVALKVAGSLVLR